MTPARTRNARGFTLIEVLIALSLLALLMLVLGGAMFSIGQTEDRVDQRLAAADDYRTTVNFLQDVIGRVSARRFHATAADAPAEVPFFEAQPDSLSWIGIMPARFGAGGRNYMHLAVESRDGVNQLVLRFAPWNGAPGFADWSQAASQSLAAPVSALSLRYLEPVSGQWSPVWPPPGMAARDLPPTLLPAAVALQFDGPQPPWPPLIVALQPTTVSQRLLSQGLIGGGN